jgi:hypothetical protein
MKPYQPYEAVNRELYRGNVLFMEKNGADLSFSDVPSPKSRRTRRALIGIYAGTGTSHSWLWFVDLFERAGFRDLVFLDENDVVQGGLDHLDVLVISGGDTFAVAQGLGSQGADRIRSFVQNGGMYIGSCAGAYLPMNSSKPPLHLFNFVDVKITNLSKILPPTIRASHKFCTSYGCDFVFHPVREEVCLEIISQNGSRTITAPMYGGPGMRPGDTSTILASYKGFTHKTSFLVHPDLASEILLNQAAIVRTSLGKGCLYLFGPHLEHPGYPEANRWVADVVFWETGLPNWFSQPEDSQIPDQSDQNFLSGPPAFALLRNLRRELSNSRITASAMEFFPITWLIGKKTYEPEKVRVFLEAMWKRLPTLEKEHRLVIRTGSKMTWKSEKIRSTKP